MFKMIIFDMDGTLTPSRDKMQSDMIGLFKRLLSKYKVGVISGGGYEQFKKQIIELIGNDQNLLKNLYICPTCGTKMYVYKQNGFYELYSLNLTLEEKNYIKNTIKNVIIDLNLQPKQVWGNIIDDRDTQISYVILGVDAPHDVKYNWDPDFSKRKAIIEKIKDKFKNFDLLAAGTTTIDIVRKGVNKAYGIKKILEITGFSIDEVIFVGDAIFPGGNDYAPLEMGVTCKKVSSVDDTKKYIKTLLAD